MAAAMTSQMSGLAYSTAQYHTITCRGMIINGGLDWMIGFIIVLYIPLRTTIIALSGTSTQYRSLGHAKSSQSSLVVSWQRIYNSFPLTVVQNER
jgi:hypothetical protein